MTCHKIPNGFICSSAFSVDLEPYGAKVWCEYHAYLGPMFFRSDSCITEIRCPSKKTWKAYEKWREHVAQSKKIGV